MAMGPAPGAARGARRRRTGAAACHSRRGRRPGRRRRARSACRRRGRPARRRRRKVLGRHLDRLALSFGSFPFAPPANANNGTGVLTGRAHASAARMLWVVPEILPAVWVALGAMRPLSVKGRRPREILPHRHRFQMGRITAELHPAEMIDVQPGLHRTMREHPGDTMRVLRAVIECGLPIAIPQSGPCPRPAGLGAGGLIDAAPEAARAPCREGLTASGRPAHRGLPDFVHPKSFPNAPLQARCKGKCKGSRPKAAPGP